MKIIYLKATSQWGADSLIKITASGGLSVYDDSINILNISDEAEFSDFQDSRTAEGYIEVTKEMFDDFFIQTIARINELSKA